MRKYTVLLFISCVSAPVPACVAPLEDATYVEIEPGTIEFVEAALTTPPPVPAGCGSGGTFARACDVSDTSINSAFHFKVCGSGEERVRFGTSYVEARSNYTRSDFAVTGSSTCLRARFVAVSDCRSGSQTTQVRVEENWRWYKPGASFNRRAYCPTGYTITKGTTETDIDAWKPYAP